jgi:hypothetical protein
MSTITFRSKELKTCINVIFSLFILISFINIKWSKEYGLLTCEKNKKKLLVYVAHEPTSWGFLRPSTNLFICNLLIFIRVKNWVMTVITIIIQKIKSVTYLFV